VPIFDFRTTTQDLSPAINELDAAMRSGRLRHDGDPMLEWCVGHVDGRPDRRGNLYPAKQRPEQKIDAAVALMMAVGRAMAEDTNEGDLTDFLTRSPHRLMGETQSHKGIHGATHAGSARSPSTVSRCWSIGVQNLRTA
jgi:phage terminase large subunit-like protein